MVLAGHPGARHQPRRLQADQAEVKTPSPPTPFCPALRPIHRCRPCRLGKNGDHQQGSLRTAGKVACNISHRVVRRAPAQPDAIRTLPALSVPRRLATAITESLVQPARRSGNRRHLLRLCATPSGLPTPWRAALAARHREFTGRAAGLRRLDYRIAKTKGRAMINARLGNRSEQEAVGMIPSAAPATCRPSLITSLHRILMRYREHRG